MVKYLLWAWPVAIVMFLIHVALVSVPACILRLVGLRKLANKWAYFNASILSNMILKLVGVKVDISGEVEDLKKLRASGTKICYISNHTSMLDIPLIEGPLALSCGFILKRQLAKVPLINIIALTLNSVFIDRNNLRKSSKSIKRGEKNIEKGASMLIFPEGTRSKTGKIAPFKHGAFKMATLSGSYIIPVTIKGIRPALEDRNRCFKPVKCYLNIGRAIPTEGLGRDETWDMVNEVEASIRKVFENLPE